MAEAAEKHEPQTPPALEHAVVRFAGDSGDGMQLTGAQFTLATALSGNDLATFPDFPAEIRAPIGTTYGVSAFQIHFGGQAIQTVGDEIDVLIAMNPAALKVNRDSVHPGGLIVIDTGAFTAKNLTKAHYEENPLENGSLQRWRIWRIDISGLTVEAVKSFDLGRKDSLRCKNMFALGLSFWMFGRTRKPTVKWLKDKFSDRPDLAGANIAALNAGHAFGETAEVPNDLHAWRVPAARFEPGLYRNVTGTEATAWGLLAGAQLAGLGMTFCSYPITPASQLLHSLAGLQRFGVTTFQAEDEIAAVCAAIGASFAGSLGVTSSSGPGVALKTEALGLAVAAELPLVVVNAQRGGPSTGLPTKTEQSDLYQAVFGRNGDAPLAVLAARTPGDCFDVAIEAVRIATSFMTPVLLLSDGFLANASEPWRIPDASNYQAFPVSFHEDAEGFQPFQRDPDTLARVWAKPGTPDLEHRIGGLERDYDSGDISYDPDNHHRMTMVRADKIDGIADHIPEQAPALGAASGKLAVVGWGSTFGAIDAAVAEIIGEGKAVSHIHLRHIWPLPRNLGELLSGFERILVPEKNNGQLATLLRSQYRLPIESYNRVTGRPFRIAYLKQAILDTLEGRSGG